MNNDRPLLAFHNDPKIKQRYLVRLRAHAKADEIIQGFYWQNGKGCATGCLMHSDKPHPLYPTELGIPESIAYLEDRVFEGLSNAEAKRFAVDFLAVIPVGADLSLVTPKFLAWLLIDERHGVTRYAYGQGKQAIQAVAALYQRVIGGGLVTDDEWVAAAEAMAAARAARATTYTHMARREAAMAAAWAAAEATAEVMAAARAARATTYTDMARTLLQLLKEASIR